MVAIMVPSIPGSNSRIPETVTALRPDNDRRHSRSPSAAAEPTRPAGSDRDLHLGDLAQTRHDRPLDRLATRRQGAQRPLAGGGEEPELPGRRRGHLCGELPGAVEQSDVRRADRITLVSDDALDDGLLRHVDALEGDPAGGHAAHQASSSSAGTSPGSSPSAIGTPTSEPYSVQEPS